MDLLGRNIPQPIKTSNGTSQIMWNNIQDFEVE